MNNLSNKQLNDLISVIIMMVTEGVLNKPYLNRFLEDNDIVISKEVYDHIIDVVSKSTINW